MFICVQFFCKAGTLWLSFVIKLELLEMCITFGISILNSYLFNLLMTFFLPNYKVVLCLLLILQVFERDLLNEIYSASIEFIKIADRAYTLFYDYCKYN